MVKFSNGDELVDGLTVAQMIESKAICYFNQHHWDFYELMLSAIYLDKMHLDQSIKSLASQIK